MISVRLYLEVKRTEKDVKKMEGKILLLSDEMEIQKARNMIVLRKALWSRDFYRQFGKNSI